jgi:nucleotide sugar dehydrogenase
MRKKASVLGIGRLGLCFSLTLEKSGYDVVGLDIREDYVKQVNEKTFETIEPGVEARLTNATDFKATINLDEALSHSDMLFVTVRTESLPDGEYDHRQVESLLESLISYGKLNRNKDLVMCCNVNPGYSDEIQDRLKEYGYSVSFNPEWVAQGRVLYDQSYPDLVVIGECNHEAGDRIEQVYKDICLNSPIIHRMNRLSAEITKVSLNCFLSSKIALANFIGDIARSNNLDPDVILNAISSDSRISSKFFSYGFGYGGPCFPRDISAIIHYSKKIGLKPHIYDAVMNSNANHLHFQVEDYVKYNKDKEKEIVISVTYKEGVTLIDYSQQLLFAVELAKLDYNVVICDKKEVIENVKNEYGDNMFTFREI